MRRIVQIQSKGQLLKASNEYQFNIKINVIIGKFSQRRGWGGVGVITVWVGGLWKGVGVGGGSTMSTSVSRVRGGRGSLVRLRDTGGTLLGAATTGRTAAVGAGVGVLFTAGTE
uniref:Uncharacterized protein n=1 Tax=Cacopsylla melanoneura TaxID=428564 RepID=A0A8D8PU96_9HEMI